jgi:hypothetical protein
MTDPHWTQDLDGYVFMLLSDFVGQVQDKLEQLGRGPEYLAERMTLPVAVVTTMLERPQGMSFKTVVTMARALDLHVSLVGYDAASPVSSEIFRRCWKAAGAPADFFHPAVVKCPYC